MICILMRPALLGIEDVKRTRRGCVPYLSIAPQTSAYLVFLYGMSLVSYGAGKRKYNICCWMPLAALFDIELPEVESLKAKLWEEGQNLVKTTSLITESQYVHLL